MLSLLVLLHVGVWLHYTCYADWCKCHVRLQSCRCRILELALGGRAIERPVVPVPTSTGMGNRRHIIVILDG